MAPNKRSASPSSRARQGAGFSEGQAIELFKRRFSRAAAFVSVGIGDDAAVIDLDGERLVWSVDTSVEQVHFRREWLGLRQIARRAVHAAVSDLAAMGAEPVAALSSLILPAECSRRDLAALGDGQAQAAAELDCPIVGGNISRGAQLSLTLTVLGKAERPLLRTGARRGDELWLIGRVGLARAGLLSLSKGPKSGVSPALSTCRAAWTNPRARIAEGLKLANSAHAAIDVSDGVASDARQLASASAVKIVVDADALRGTLTRALHRAARELGEDPLDLALRGGEDYALLATGPKRRRPKFAQVIGSVRTGHGAVLLVQGKERPLPAGFDHFPEHRRLDRTVTG